MDYVKFYTTISKPFKSNKVLLLVFKFVYKILPIIVFICYPVLLGYLAYTHSYKLFRCITVPLGVFLSVTVFRALVNAERPYEKYGTIPIFPKSTKGKSFPSRHTASAAVIAMAMMYVNPVAGAVFLTVSFLIALSRIVGGVHFPKDVAVGFFYAVIVGGFFLFFL